jgi:centromeric protein E
VTFSLVWSLDPCADADYVYTGEDTNYGVYDASVRKLIRKAVEGYNTTVFAYGQTSSGKTHTMRGHTDEAGIISLAAADLFEEISSVRSYDTCLTLATREEVHFKSNVPRDLQ